MKPYCSGYDAANITTSVMVFIINIHTALIAITTTMKP